MPYKQAPKSMALKALIGKQKNLPEALKNKILEAPESVAKQASYPANSAEMKQFEKSKEIEQGADEKIQNIKSSDKSQAAKKRKVQRVIKKARKAGGSSTGTRKERMDEANTIVSPGKKYKKGC
jgi:tRNA U34 5-carboxymethylaminomethyl modifying GTPase MnmE/TrmE